MEMLEGEPIIEYRRGFLADLATNVKKDRASLVLHDVRRYAVGFGTTAFGVRLDDASFADVFVDFVPKLGW